MTRTHTEPRSTTRAIASATAVLLLLGATLASLATAEPKTDDEKTLYFLGVAVSQNLGDFMLTPAEQEIVMEGLRSGLNGSALELDPAVYGPMLQQLANDRRTASLEKETAATTAFLEKAAEQKGAEKTASGLIYTEITPGKGESPGATDVVKVHYHGTLRDGTVFDSSVQRGTPAEFPLNRVIACWTEGVAKMKVGGKSKLVCPPAIAYGDRGSPPRIKGGAALTFEVELIEIVEQ